jgi:hypothetical protein
VSTESVLVDFFYAPPVGHAVEALRYAHGYHLADPERRIAVALNAQTALELTQFCPFVADAYPISFQFGPVDPEDVPEFSHVPRDWDWVVDESRRYMEWQIVSFPSLARYYQCADQYFRPRLGHGPAGGRPPTYLAHQPLRFELPGEARQRAREHLPDGPKIAVLPAGSGLAIGYPSVTSWSKVLGALREATGASFVLLGKTVVDGQTITTLSATDLGRLQANTAGMVDCFDLPLADELAVIEACDVLLSPHSGMGFTASCVGTPWATISGGRWAEYFFNGVPFRSVLPDPERFPCFTHESAGPDSGIEDPDGEGPRTPSMSGARIDADLDRIVTAACELLAGTVSYEAAMSAYATNILEFCQPGAVPYSVDDDLIPFLPKRSYP